uniref:Uncharacterized protein n=1 Tax=Anguilla anguilla TaxID=7936 RepID=A0A0E9VUM0_ANGAN
MERRNRVWGKVRQEGGLALYH